MSRTRYQQHAELVARGLSDGEIARHLGISVSAVEKRGERLRRRVGAPTRAALAAWVLGAHRDHVLDALRDAVAALDAGAVAAEELERLRAVAEMRDDWELPIPNDGGGW